MSGFLRGALVGAVMTAILFGYWNAWTKTEAAVLPFMDGHDYYPPPEVEEHSAIDPSDEVIIACLDAQPVAKPNPGIERRPSVEDLQ